MPDYPKQGCTCQKCTAKRNAHRNLLSPDWEGPRFIVCEHCGNKRCPHATDHKLACTGSNEPGQKGSVYE